MENDENFHSKISGETISGKSQLELGNFTETIHYYTQDPDDPEKGNYNIYPVYGIRFKGTDQCAAYRWEMRKLTDKPLERIVSIKIKALPRNTQIQVNEVANESFWEKEYIEFEFPTSGYYLDTKPNEYPEEDNNKQRGIAGDYWTSTQDSQSDKSAYSLNGYVDNITIRSFPTTDLFQLRLVKVE